jgi:YD repeat-containing protein
LGATWTTTFDAASQPTVITDPLNRSVTTTYDLAGWKSSRMDARGVLVSYLYDPANQLTGRLYNNGDPAVTLGYDAAGNRMSMADGTGSTSFSFDAVRQLLAVASPAGNVSYAWDPVGQRQNMTASGSGTFTNMNDPAARLVNPLNPRAGRRWSTTWPTAESARNWPMARMPASAMTTPTT